MTGPRLVPAGVTLRAQVDARWPNRDRTSDGWIGDTAHQARPSDHNPDRAGWVHALDLDKDGINAQVIADQLCAYARSGLPGSRRLLNLVWRDRVASGTDPAHLWTWRGTGYGHFHHLHVSFTAAAETDSRPFPLPVFARPAPPTPAPTTTEDPPMIITRTANGWKYLLSGGRLVGLNPAGFASLADDALPTLSADETQWARLVTAYGPPAT